MMNSAKYVEDLIENMKESGAQLQDVAWEAAKACVGFAYVFGARGQLCTPANRRARYREDHPTIKSKCKNFDGNGTCKGCKWFPEEQRTRFFDCRGYTYWVLKQVYGWELMGAGCTSQWNDEKNWAAKGEIATIPDDILVCLFVRKGSKMEHTGFGFHGETLECSSGVQYNKARAKKWTHWGIPVVCAEPQPEPEPEPTPEPTPPGPAPEPKYHPTLRKGDAGIYVVEMQEDLLKAGEKLPRFCADGIFGNETLAALKNFQRKNPPLVVDGICGPKTWAELDKV